MGKETMIGLFVYGTLLEEKIQKKLLGRIPEQEGAILEDFEKTKIHIPRADDFPIVVPRPNCVVAGKILKLENWELDLLDNYEGQSYRRIWINDLSAWIYC